LPLPPEPRLWGLMPIEFHRDGPWDTPEGWVWAQLGGVSRETGRIDPARHMHGEFTYIDLSAVDDGRIVQAQHLPVDKSPSRARQPVASGDTLLSCVRVYLRNNALVPPELDGAVASTAFCVLRPTNVLDPKFLFWFIHSRKFTETLIPLQRGNSPPAVLDDDVRDQWIPIPPFAEQQRIVGRIDKLFTEIADGETALDRARDDLDTWRRSLIKAAVTGELTREWREHNKSNETGKDALMRIATARQSFKSSKSKGRHFVQDEALDDRLIDLPESWEWSSLGAIGEVVGGVTVDKKRRPDDPVTIPYLRVANVQRGYLDLSEMKSIAVDRSVAEALALKKGDILLNEGGDRDKIGRGWVWDGQIDGCIHQNHVFRVRPYDPAINPYFVSHFANEMGRRFFVEKGKQTTNLASISMSKISQLPIPIVPAAELQEAMRILDESLLVKTDVEAELAAASVSAAARQSILKAAFEGRLVKQDPRDEPAEILLARLDQSAPNSTPQPSRRRRRLRSPTAGAEA
jgi:type I restriction enzyme S subunit